MNNSFLYICLAVFAGAVIPFQSAINSVLGKNLVSPLYATLAIFIVSTLGLALYAIITRETVPTLEQFSASPKWSYFGGILGAIYVLLLVVLVPKLGVGTATVLVLVGQLIAAMLVDQIGFLGTSVQFITWQRFLGVLLLCGGAYLIAKF